MQLTLAFVALAGLLALPAQAADFAYRFYDSGNCDHNVSPGSTYPPNNQGPNQGNLGACYSAPTGINWNRVELNRADLRVQAFCDINCLGGERDSLGVNCNVPPPGCAVGSFRAIDSQV